MFGVACVNRMVANANIMPYGRRFVGDLRLKSDLFVLSMELLTFLLLFVAFLGANLQVTLDRIDLEALLIHRRGFLIRLPL